MGICPCALLAVEGGGFFPILDVHAASVGPHCAVQGSQRAAVQILYTVLILIPQYMMLLA